MKFLFATLALFVSFVASAQYRGYKWVVPDSAGIDFTTPSPSVFYSKAATGYNLPCVNLSCIASEEGDLLFYTYGHKIYDRNHDSMPNSYGLASNYGNYTGSVILPFPENEDSLYILIHSWYANVTYQRGIYYTVVNMNKRNGYGDVVPGQKNVLAFENEQVSSQLVTIRHANGRDWWVVGKKSGITSDYYKLLVTPQGVEYVGEQAVGFILESWCNGEMCASSNGDQIALAMYQAIPPGSTVVYNRIEVLDFNRCSGTLSNPQFINPSVCYTVSFSPNGKLLYYSTFDTLYQVAGLDGSQPVSTTAVGSQPYFNPTSSATLDTSYSFSEHELAPDGKIYLPLSRHTYPNAVYDPRNMSLCTIDSPDVQGIACHFTLNSFYLGGKRSSWGLPNMPNYNLGKLVGSPCDTLTSISVNSPSLPSSFSVYPNPSSGNFTLRVVQRTPFGGDFGSGLLSVVVSDAVGRVLITKPALSLSNVALQGKQTTYNVEANLKSGVYRCTVLNNGKPLRTLPLVVINEN